MNGNDKLKQRPHKNGGTFDIAIRVQENENGSFRGKVRIRHSFERHGVSMYMTDFKSAAAIRSTNKAARKDAKALRNNVLQRYLAAPL